MVIRMDFLYETETLKDIMGSHYCGPDVLPHDEEVRVAKLDDDPESDGYGVEIYCTACPAQFFTIKILDSTNSIGEERGGFALTTGSGMAELSYQIALSVNQGMIRLSV